MINNNHELEFKKSSSYFKKLIIALIVVFIFTIGGVSTLVQALPNIFKSTLNPIPYSPPMPERLTKMCNSNYVKNNYVKNNLEYTQNGNSIVVKPASTNSKKTTITSSMNILGRSVSFLEDNGTITKLNDDFRVGSSWTDQSLTYSLIMYPQIKDLIPPFATITSVLLIDDYVSTSYPSSIPIEAREINAQWDPRTITGQPLPTISQNQCSVNIWDLTTFYLPTRQLDVTNTVLSWFYGGSSFQWGLKISTPFAEDVDIGFTNQNPPRLYVEYEMPSDSYKGNLSGGTWYDDSICPGLWLSQRATYFNKTGILDNSVKTRVFVDARSIVPPFGYDNQSFRFVIGGVLINTGDSSTMRLKTTTWSPYSRDKGGEPPPKTDPGATVSLDGFVAPQLASDCEPYFDEDEYYAYTTIPDQEVDMSDEEEEEEEEYYIFHTRWGYTITIPAKFVKKGRRIRSAPHGNLKATTTTNRLYDDNDEWVENLCGIMELEPMNPTPPSGVMDKKLPQIEYGQTIDIGASGSSENRIDKGAAGTQSGWTDQTYAVNPLNAAFELENNDFSIPCHGGLSIAFGRTFSSASVSTTGILGPGWHTNLDQRIYYYCEGYLHYLSASGQEYVFTPRKDSIGNIISYDPPPMLDWKVDLVGTDHVEIYDRFNDRRLIFSPDGSLVEIKSSQGGRILLNRDSNGFVTAVTDVYSNRSLSFTYDSSGRLTSVIGPDSNRNWTYEYDTNGDMIEATDPEGGLWRYEYNDKHNVIKAYDPRNNSINMSYSETSSELEKAPQEVGSIRVENATTGETVTYDKALRQTTITQATGELAKYKYDRLGIVTEVRDNNDAAVKFEYDKDHITDIKRIRNQYNDLALGAIYNQDRQVTETRDAVGNKSYYMYWPNGRIKQYKDKENHITTYNWVPDGSLPLSVIDPLGRSVSFNYDSSKNLTSVIAPYKTGVNAQTQFEYDTNGYVRKVINAENKATNYEYNVYGELTKITDPLGNIEQYTRNKLGHVTKIKGPSPNQYEHLFEYDACMNLTKHTNPRGYYTRYEYNSKNQRNKVIDALNNVREYFYDDSGKLTKVKDSLGRESQLQYDTCGRLLKTIDQAGKINQLVYDIGGRIINFKGPEQDEVAITYNSLGLVTKTVTKEGSENEYSYNKEGLVTKTINPEDKETNYIYDACHRIIKTIDALNNFSTVEYWPSGNVKKIVDPLNHKTELDYNKIGLTTEIKNEQGKTVKFEYDDNSNLIKKINALNKFVTYEYNEYDICKKITNELGKSWTCTFDQNMNKLTETTPLGRVTTWEYDQLDRVSKVKSPMNNIVEYSYDSVGNLVSVTDPLSHVNQFTYTNNYRLEKTIDALNNQTKYEYSDGGDVTKLTSPKNTYQTFTYDRDHRLTGVTDPMGYTSNYEYDDNGALTKRKNPKPSGGQTEFTYMYDALGRRTSSTDEAGMTTTSTYNAIGLVTRLDQPNSKYVTSTYDTLNRTTGVNFGDGTSFSFAYDDLSRTTSWTDQFGSQSFTYDDASRLTSTTDPFGDQISYSYDDDNKLSSFTDTLGQTSITYDNDSRPTQLALPGGDTFVNSFDASSRLTNTDMPIGVDVNFIYDNANKLAQKSYDTDIFLRFNSIDKDLPLQDKMKKQLQYDVQYQIDTRSGYKPYRPERSLTTLFSFGYTYDANSNVSSRTYPDGSHSFTYDDYDRLTQAVMPNGTYTYTYDCRSNRTSQRFVDTYQTVDETTTYTYSIDDRLTAFTVVNNLNQQTIRTASYTYDNAGNPTQKQITEGGNTYTTTYTYYDDNRIKTITLPNEDLVTYTYHADGSRATKETPTEWIKFQYNGSSLIKETHCDPSDHSTVLMTLYYQSNRIILDPGSQGGGDQIKYYVATDMEATCYKLLSDTGAVVAEYAYDPFGTRIYNSNPTLYNPIGYAGTYYDTESGLYFAQARHYDSTVGRFTTKDIIKGTLPSPISQNRYIYCCNNPATLIDPSGLSPETWGGGIDKDDFLWTSTDGKFSTFMETWDLVMACFDWEQWKKDNPGKDLGPRASIFARKDGKGYVLCVLPEPVYHLPIEPGSINRPSASALAKYNKGEAWDKLPQDVKFALLKKIAEQELRSGESANIDFTTGKVTFSSSNGQRTIHGKDITAAMWADNGTWKPEIMMYKIGNECPKLFWGPGMDRPEDPKWTKEHQEAGMIPGQVYKGGGADCWEGSWTYKYKKNDFYGFSSVGKELIITIRTNDVDVTEGNLTKTWANYLILKLPGENWGSASSEIAKRLVSTTEIINGEKHTTVLIPNPNHWESKNGTFFGESGTCAVTVNYGKYGESPFPINRVSYYRMFQYQKDASTGKEIIMATGAYIGIHIDTFFVCPNDDDRWLSLLLTNYKKNP